jgi:hypothetical protein
MIIFKIFKWLFLLVFCSLLGISLLGTLERSLMTEQQLKDRIEWRKQRIKDILYHDKLVYESTRKRGTE